MIIYRTSGTWGAGKGSNLTAAEVDGNFYDLEERVETLETYGATAESITNVTSSGSTITFYTSSGAQYTVTVSVPRIATVQTVSGTTFEPTLAEADRYLRFTNAAGCTVNLPDNASAAFPTGTEIHLRQAAAGTVYITSDSGVTVNGIDGYELQTAVQGSVVTCKKVGQDEWDVFGMLADSASVVSA